MGTPLYQTDQPNRAERPEKTIHVAAVVLIVLAITAGLVACVTLTRSIPALQALVSQTGTTAGHTSAPQIIRSGEWANEGRVGPGNSLLVVAPGNSRVVYLIPSVFQTTFQRSDDGGKTWKAYSAPSQEVTKGVPTPSIYDIGVPQLSFDLEVSPLNAMVIVATVQSGSPDPNCSSYSTLYNAQYTCVYQYVSTDGGSTWTTPDLPSTGYLGDISTNITQEYTIPPFVVQGNRLYSNGLGGYRLVSSTDGVHWHAADAPLAAQNLLVFEYAATPVGSTLFATTLPAQGGGLFSRELWRSDDAGVHWSDLGPFPENQGGGQGETALLGAGTSGTGAIVYYGTLYPGENGYTNYSGGQDIAPGDMYASVDNGKTWQTAPAVGIAGTVAAPWYLGTLDDGSLVLMFDTRLVANPEDPGNVGQQQPPSGTITFGAWRPGEKSWRPISPPLMALQVPQGSGLSGQVDDPGPWLIPAHAGTPQTLWALTYDTDGYTYWACRADPAS
jgi:BNR/Asp-box repeat